MICFIVKQALFFACYDEYMYMYYAETELYCIIVVWHYTSLPIPFQVYIYQQKKLYKKKLKFTIIP